MSLRFWEAKLCAAGAGLERQHRSFPEIEWRENTMGSCAQCYLVANAGNKLPEERMVPSTSASQIRRDYGRRCYCYTAWMALRNPCGLAWRGCERCPNPGLNMRYKWR